MPGAWTIDGGSAQLDVPLAADTATWSEFTPVLHKLGVRFSGAGADDAREISFGVRELRTDGTKFLVNGRDTQMRGTHHGSDFPLTGFPQAMSPTGRNCS